MAAPNGFTGTVQSGSGASYSVLLSDGSTVTASVLQIDAGETVPAGTKVLVVKVGSAYYFQPPVWMPAA